MATNTEKIIIRSNPNLNKIVAEKAEKAVLEFRNRKNMNIYEKAIEKWGHLLQIYKIQEEAIELSLAINNMYCPTKDKDKAYQDFISECADVSIMLKQAEIIIGKDRLDSEICKKLEKLQKHLDN